jgi:hypothetical protein
VDVFESSRGWLFTGLGEAVGNSVPVPIFSPSHQIATLFQDRISGKSHS